jgi:prolyl-tRNA synthetase
MKQSHLFTKIRRDSPKDEVSKNAQLLIQAGFLYKEMAGVYDFLPLGLLVLEKINKIIREEMILLNGQEVLLSALQEKSLWEKTGRWDSKDVDVWFKTMLGNDTPLALGFTHEEPITRMMKDYISSYRDLPLFVYQIQTKFRNEVRAKSGIMRTREFLMKDAYSFCTTEEEHHLFYKKVEKAYTTIFSRVGLKERTYKTFASGGSFSAFSHEYQTLSKAGEDRIFVNEENALAINEEVYTDAVKKELGLEKALFKEEKAVEVGNIFTLGTKFSLPLGLFYKNEKGEKKPVFMGSYGIGPSRLLGVIAEVYSDEKGLLWPSSVAPFNFHILLLSEESEMKESAESLYAFLKKEGKTVLFDERKISAGEKFIESDMIGIPYRIVVSKKTQKEKLFEIVERKTGKVSFLKKEDILKSCTF